MLIPLIFYSVLCLGMKLVKRRLQCLFAFVGGKQWGPCIKIQITVSGAGHISKTVLLCSKYRNYVADVSLSVSRADAYVPLWRWPESNSFFWEWFVLRKFLNWKVCFCCLFVFNMGLTIFFANNSSWQKLKSNSLFFVLVGNSPVYGWVGWEVGVFDSGRGVPLQTYITW